MSGGDIAGLTVFCVVVWVIAGMVAASAVANSGGSDRDTVIAFFWPITLPIMFVFGVVYAVVSTVKMGRGWFK